MLQRRNVNLKKKILVISLAVLLLLTVPILVQTPVTSQQNICSSSVVSAEVWSDNFNDGDISDWSVWGWNGTDAEKFDGNFTLADGSLRTQGDNTSIAIHSYPTTAVGTWSFDVDCVDNDNHHFYVAFFAGTPTNDTLDPPHEYGLMVVTGVFAAFDTEFVLYRRDAGSFTLSNVIGRYNLETVSGWHHIDITHDADGRFCAYFNETLGISGSDGTYDNAEYFSFYSPGGPAIDNVRVSNSIDIDKVGPFLSNPGNQEIDVGEAFLLDLDATDYSGISKWWCNDTEHFSIDSNGDIENATILASGSYGIQVSVNDTANYITTIEFTLTVITPTTTSGTGGGFDSLTIILIAGGGILVIIVLIVVMKSRK
jgi:hypothetical protein